MSKTPQSDLAAELALRQMVGDGVILSTLLSAVVFGSLYHNPSIWYNDYPPEMQAQAGPPGAAAQRQRRLLALIILTLFFGGLVASNLRLKRRNGGRFSFLAAFLHAYGIFSTFNLWDALVIDYWILIRLQPRWAQLPGTEGMDPARYAPLSFQLKNWLKGVVLGLVAAVPIAAITRGQSRP